MRQQRGCFALVSLCRLASKEQPPRLQFGTVPHVRLRHRVLPVLWAGRRRPEIPATEPLLDQCLQRARYLLFWPPGRVLPAQARIEILVHVFTLFNGVPANIPFTNRSSELANLSQAERRTGSAPLRCAAKSSPAAARSPRLWPTTRHRRSAQSPRPYIPAGNRARTAPDRAPRSLPEPRAASHPIPPAAPTAAF